MAGTREYRVLKPASQGIRKGTSKVLSVDVYRWETLSGQPAGANANISAFGTARIGTKVYSPSLMATNPGAPAYVEYTLGRLCTDLRTTYALDDSSESGSTGAVKLLVDGVTKVDQGLVVGQVVESTTDLTDAFRLRYELASSARRWAGRRRRPRRSAARSSHVAPASTVLGSEEARCGPPQQPGGPHEASHHPDHGRGRGRRPDGCGGHRPAPRPTTPASPRRTPSPPRSTPGDGPRRGRRQGPRQGDAACRRQEGLPRAARRRRQEVDRHRQGDDQAQRHLPAHRRAQRLRDPPVPRRQAPLRRGEEGDQPGRRGPGLRVAEARPATAGRLREHRRVQHRARRRPDLRSTPSSPSPAVRRRTSSTR